jgi:uncharacterized membrane protein
MTKIEDSIIIDAPAAEVFAYASDWRRWPEWFEGLSDVRSTSGVSRGTGARYSYRARVLGVSVSVETELQDFVEGLGWTGAGTRGLPHRTHWRFEAQGQSTKFTYGLEYRLPPPLLGPMLDALFARREWRGIIRRSLLNVQRHFSLKEPRKTKKEDTL